MERLNFGKQTLTILKSKASAKKKSHTERDEHIKFVTWLKAQGYRVSHAANGGYRNALEAMQFKRMGVSAGFPDIFVPIPTEHYHGFFIEMKSHTGGKISDWQADWLKYLQDNGYYANVAHGFEDAKAQFLEYLNDFPKAA